MSARGARCKKSFLLGREVEKKKKERRLNKRRRKAHTAEKLSSPQRDSPQGGGECLSEGYQTSGKSSSKARTAAAEEVSFNKNKTKKTKRTGGKKQDFPSYPEKGTK